ncbi:DUF885 domain-containing protein [Kangiella spongicola]|uniref:DUF885 domain-containing protein n=1 Tax=Kangiella spongicola TaxID=796379 RepID=A0A318D271_9GAMM|nr:DUF885 domain-containing protein [Kangiella spongicola]PXF63250.1 DUF885 domain-containing protein [Kangiella spongicola]
MKSFKFQLSAVALAIALTACGDDASKENTNKAAKATTSAEQVVNTEQAASEEQALSEAEKTKKIYQSYWEENLKMNPLNATFMGDHRYNDRLGDFGTEKGRAEALAFHKKYLSEINQIDESQLEGQDLLSYQIFKNERQAAIEGTEYPDYMQPIQQFYNPFNFFAMLGSGKSAQPFNTVEDYENWLSRLNQAYDSVDVIIKNMRTGMENGVVQPKALMVKVLPQLKAHIVDDVEQSLFYTPIKNMPESFSPEDKQRLTKEYVNTIKTMVVPMYSRMHDFIQDEYLPATRETAGMVALPNGKEWYAFKVKQTTSTDLTPDEIHQIGLDEVARIHGEMKGVMEQVGFEGSLQEFFEFTKNDPQFIFDSKEDMLQAYEDLRETLDKTAPDLFKVIPEAQFEIRAVEAFREQSSSSASYQRPAPDGSRPGIFYVNTYDLSARPTWTVESLYLHEAVPGHHFQISTQQELKDIPDFRRFGGTTAFIEGWGLYSESLGKEMGVYTDPYQYYGALSAELWRAIRLVVDTGLHAKGWTREEVLEYMEKNSAAAEARRVSEAERFMAIPSQALAYKIGQLKIRELRTLAETELGDNFDVREFHYQVLKDGALPLNILETKIKRWIDSQKS